ncbi:MAG: MFS transporter [Pseudomonadota bacterium]
MLEMQRKSTSPFLALLSLPATAMGFALSVQISALSWILTTQYGLDIHDVGLVWAAGPLAGIIGQVIIGIVSDNTWLWGGRRRPYILIGGVLAALMLLALPNIDVIADGLGVDGILGIAILIALALDLSINVSFNPTRSIIADVTTSGPNRTRGYTWMQTISGSFGVLAYGIGAVWDNYTLIYFGVFLVLLFSVLPPLFVEEPRELNESHEAQEKQPVSLGAVLLNIRPLWGFLVYGAYALTMRLLHIEVEHYWIEGICAVATLVLVVQTLFSRKTSDGKGGGSLEGFRRVLAAHAFSWLGVQTMFVYMFAYVQQTLPDLNDVDMGRVVSISFLILNAVAAVLPAFVLEPLTRRLGRVKTHVLCLLIMTIGYGAILLAGSSLTMLYACMALLGVGWAAIVSLPFAIMSNKVDPARMGLFMGLFNLAVVLPQLTASLGVGVAVSRAEDKGLIFVICCASLLLSTIAWMRVEEDEGAESELIPSSGH